MGCCSPVGVFWGPLIQGRRMEFLNKVPCLSGTGAAISLLRGGGGRGRGAKKGNRPSRRKKKMMTPLYIPMTLNEKVFLYIVAI